VCNPCRHTRLGGFYPHPPLMCVVDRARGPHSCPTHAPFRPTLTPGPSSRGKRVVCRLLPVPSRLNSHAALKPLSTSSISSHYSTNSTSYSYIVFLSLPRRRLPTPPGRQGRPSRPLGASNLAFLPSRAVNHLIGANPSAIPAPSRTAGTQSDR
jgi:hypothetical protein